MSLDDIDLDSWGRAPKKDVEKKPKKKEHGEEGDGGVGTGKTGSRVGKKTAVTKSEQKGERTGRAGRTSENREGSTTTTSKTRGRARTRKTEISSISFDLTPKTRIKVERVPIDAYRGLYYLLMKKTDKKLSKVELKRNLQRILSNQEELRRLIQNIIDVVFST